MRPSRLFLWTLTLILLLAAASRLYRIETQSIWFDEGWSAYAAAQPSPLAAAAADATNPPLYYALLNLTAYFTGASEFSLRFFSLLVGLPVIPLAYQFGRRLFGRRTGLYAAFVTAFSPLLWWASQEARMYTLLALLVALAALAWHTLLRKSLASAWLALWGAELALLYTHNAGLVAALWLNAVTLLVWLVRRNARRPDWRLWIGGQVAVALLWSPYFALRYLLLAGANSAVASAPRLSLALAGDIWAAFWAGNWALVGREPLFGTFSPAVGLSGVLLALTLALVPWRRPAARWLVLHVVLLCGGVVAGLIILGNELHGRYLVMIAPLLAIPTGAGIARLKPPALRPLIAAVFLIPFFAAVYYTQNPLYRHDDARGMVQYYADTLTAQDTVLAWSYADRYELAYYWDRLNVQVQRIILPEGQDFDAIAPLLPVSGDVALNVWYTQRADFRGMMDCILSHGAVNLPEVFTTYGMSSRLYRAPSARAPQLQPFNDDFGIARIEAIGDIPRFTADRALCLPVEIILTQPAAGDLKLALTVRNALGWEIARADAVFAQADQRTTSQLAPGETLTAYPLLRLPYGAPPGEYPVYARIYDDTAPSGYEPLAANGEILGRDVRLGMWTAEAAADWAQVNRQTELPVTVNSPVGSSLTLVAHNLDDALLARAFHNGDALRLTFLWRGSGDLPPLALADAEGRWRVAVSAPETPVDGVLLDWREVVIPPAAETGTAELRLADTIIARLSVEAVPAQMTPPDFETPVGVELPGVGALVGFTLQAGTVSLNAPFDVTLVWQAGDAAPPVSYTVFVQLLDADGRLIAQSDSLPVSGARPTTGWRRGEYVVDSHTLTFNDSAHPGEARLIAGMYDAATGARVRLADGSDAIPLPGTVTAE